VSRLLRLRHIYWLFANRFLSLSIPSQQPRARRKDPGDTVQHLRSVLLRRCQACTKDMSYCIICAIGSTKHGKRTRNALEVKLPVQEGAG
jgi:hypothetical protein